MVNEIHLDTENLFYGVTDPEWAALVMWALLWWNEERTGARPGTVRSYGKIHDSHVRDFIRGLWIVGATQQDSDPDHPSTAHFEMFEGTLRITHTTVGGEKNAAEDALIAQLRCHYPDSSFGGHHALLGSADHSVAEYANSSTGLEGVNFVLPPSGRWIRLAHGAKYASLSLARATLITDVVTKYRRRLQPDDELLSLRPFRPDAEKMARHAIQATREADENARQRRLLRSATEVAHDPGQAHVFDGRRQRSSVTGSRVVPAEELLKPLTTVIWKRLASASLESELWSDSWHDRALAGAVLEVLKDPDFLKVGASAEKVVEDLRDGRATEYAARALLGRAALLAIARAPAGENGRGFGAAVRQSGSLRHLTSALTEVQPLFGATSR